MNTRHSGRRASACVARCGGGRIAALERVEPRTPLLKAVWLVALTGPLALGLGACGSLLGFEPLTLAHVDNGDSDGAAPTDDGSPSMVGDGAVDGADASPSVCDADLTKDPLNCGRCVHECQGGACERGVCQPLKLADRLGVPEGLAVDSDSVFVAEFDTNRILKFGKATAPSPCTTAPLPTECVFTDDQTLVFKPTAITVDATTVYWTNTGPYPHEIHSCGRAGCGVASTLVVTLAKGAFAYPNGLLLPIDLAIRDGQIFWAENTVGAIRSVPVGGGPMTTYVANAAYAPIAVAVDDTHVFFTDDSPGHPPQVQAVPRASGAVTAVASPAGKAAGIALTGTGALFWTVPTVTAAGDGLVQSALPGSVPGGPRAATTAASSQVSPSAILTDAANVYWLEAGSANGATGRILTCPLTGCPAPGPVVLASQQKHPRHLAQDATALYWSNEGVAGSTTYDGQVWRVAKP